MNVAASAAMLLHQMNGRSRTSGMRISAARSIQSNHKGSGSTPSVSATSRGASDARNSCSMSARIPRSRGVKNPDSSGSKGDAPIGPSSLQSSSTSTAPHMGWNSTRGGDATGTVPCDDRLLGAEESATCWPRCGAPSQFGVDRATGADLVDVPMVGGVRAGDLAQDLPTVGPDDPAMAAARLIAERRLPGIAVVDAGGRPVAVLPASQVLRVVVPDYVREDPALARVVDEAGAERLCVQRLVDERVGDLVPAGRHRVELAAVDGDATVSGVRGADGAAAQPAAGGGRGPAGSRGC